MVKILEQLEDYVNELTRYFVIISVLPPALFAHGLTTDQLRNSGIPDKYIFRIEANVKTPSRNELSINYYLVNRSIEVRTQERKSEHEQFEYDFAQDQEFIVFRDALAKAVRTYEIKQSIDSHLDSSFPEGVIRQQVARIMLPWPLTQSQFADCIDSSLKHSKGFMCPSNGILAVYRNVPRNILINANIPNRQLSRKPSSQK